MRNYSMTPRGIGIGSGECFVCGQVVNCKNDCASFVPSKETGEAISILFDIMGCFGRLDYRPYESTWIQYKIVACPNHDENLKLFVHHVSKNNIITAELLIKVLKLES